MYPLGFKELTTDNWMIPDATSMAFVRISQNGEIHSISGEDYIRSILEPRLTNSVPIDVVKLFEVARGMMAYGFFFYPLYTLGSEQIFRVLEAAVTYKCKILKGPKPKDSYKKKINWLLEQKIIPQNYSDSYHNARIARNLTSHPESQMIITPGNAIGIVIRIAKYINLLY